MIFIDDETDDVDYEHINRTMLDGYVTTKMLSVISKRKFAAIDA